MNFAILDSDGKVIAKVTLRKLARICARIAKHPVRIYRRGGLEKAIFDGLADFARRELHSR